MTVLGGELYGEMTVLGGEIYGEIHRHWWNGIENCSTNR
jgi:hypothetical protein